MPVHNWRGIEDGVFHDLHCSWIAEIKRMLNSGILPPSYHAMAEQRANTIAPDVLALEFAESTPDDDDGDVAVMAPPKTTIAKSIDVLAYVNRQNRVAIRHASSDRLVAVLEIVSRGNKNAKDNFETFMRKAHACLNQGIHFTYVDVHPHGPFDPRGIHDVLTFEKSGEPSDPSTENQLSAAGFEAGPVVNCYVNLFGVGEAIPETPLYLRRNRYIMLPLEQSYMAAFAGFSGRTRKKIEANAQK